MAASRSRIVDEADITQERLEREMALTLKSRRCTPILPFTGYCHWCGKITAAGRRFCDADCRDDWERAHAGSHRR